MMAKLQCCIGCVLEVRQVIRRKAVSQCVVRPLTNTSGSTRLLERFTETVCRCDVARMFANWKQPLAEIRLHVHEPALCGLCLLRFDFNQSGLEIDFTPIEPLNL